MQTYRFGCNAPHMLVNEGKQMLCNFGGYGTTNVMH